MSEEQLRPCPFCGSTHLVESNNPSLVHCNDCGMITRTNEWKKAFAWREVDRLKAELDKAQTALRMAQAFFRDTLASETVRLKAELAEARKEIDLTKECCAERETALEKYLAARAGWIQERKDLEEMEDNFTVKGGFDGKHRPEIEAEIDAEIEEKMKEMTEK